MKKYFVILLIATFSKNYAQFQEIFAASNDAEKFVTNYMQPVFRGLMFATNSAWITSAKPIKTFHFELNINASGAFVPPNSENFKFNQTDYQYLRIDSGPDEIPTIAGGESQTRLKIVIPYNSYEVKVLDFDSPDGIKNKLPLNLIPAPTLQFSMGLPMGSEVNLRYAPTITDNNDAFFQLIGLGLKHSISQYLPVGKQFNLAAHVAYQHISAGYDEANSNKALHINISAISIQSIASFDSKLISLYGAIGYSKGFTTMEALGTYNYTFDIQDNAGNHIDTETITITDPVKFDYSIDGIKAKAGIKLKLVFFQIFADYTLQEFPVATAGIGFKF